MISIIDYGLGNIKSLINSLEFLHIKYNLIEDWKEIPKAIKIILPGVGSFSEGIKNIKELNYYEALIEAIKIKKIPVLGICLGFQLLFETGKEGGVNEGLKLIKGTVEKLHIKDPNFKIPHIGFNLVYFKKNTLFERLGDSASFYFIHSYQGICRDAKDVSSICNYSIDIVSSVEKENIFGVQFHPEKSQSNGLIVLQNFSNL